MHRDTPAKPQPQDLAALLEQTKQAVERYRRLHPEWQPRTKASSATPPADPKPAQSLPASAPCSPGAGTGH